MFGFGDHEDKHQTVYGGDDHEGKFSHELVAGAASFEAAKLFEDRQRREGKPVSHAFAKEALSAFAGAEVDKLFESKGLDYLDRDQVKNQARDFAQQGYDQHYGQSEQWSADQNPSVNY
ncbi:hypothetical protein BABINDRAFT_161996 [Babjeviella inositovora NRRL Y-12698]|uniref:CipC-like antibiotic response protein n=1 Tax=Babjeviella inositovora NRRL Y-12698 TaxID=984486 RepID=A0A1E3QRD0_9ASCO|nr:uncharacterized protein BABINDRAFT_161996 [Babjeviella inositovora NRRL Y-12698]ODQ79612.1 hypothetical protein BABINDRAFT_161996 [Babjeviella inositovora NRRL Y-12698]